MRAELRITLIYVGMAAAWIFASDRLALSLEAGTSGLAFLQTFKGLLFVIFTGAILYFATESEVRRLRRAREAVVQSYETTMNGWIQALDLRNRETKHHSLRVSAVACHLARKMGIEGRDLENFRRGATLHDIGKIGLPDAILSKPGPLTDEEMAVIRTHPDVGRTFIEKVPFLVPALDIPYCHHERWDGTGYPRGLAGEAIPLAARIFSVVDVWDALAHDRVYKKAWPRQEVIDYLRKEAGGQFDPAIVDLFLRELPWIEAIDASSEMGSQAGPTPGA